MILPTKHVAPRQSLLGIGAVIVCQLESPKTVTALWDRVRDDPDVRTFKRYVLALDLLFLIGIIDYKDGRLRRSTT